MPDKPDKLVNGQILDAIRAKLREALSQKKLTKKDRLQYEILELLVMYISEDHPKVREMYSAYRPMASAMLIVGGAILTALATGRMVFTIVR